MKHLIFLLFIIPLSLFGQVESQFNGTLNIFSGYRIGSTNTFTVSGIFNSSTSQYTSNQVAIGDIIQAQSGSRFYWFHIYSIASSSGGAITCNVRDSTSTITVAPTGIVTLFRPTLNRRLPLQADGMSNVAKVSSFNTLAMKVDQLGSGTGTANCEQTLTKTSHGFRKWTPIYWNGSSWSRPTYDTIIPTYIVIDSTSANTFKVANCGNYSTTLSTGMYWFTGTNPGYTTTPSTVKTSLFEVAQGRLILQPFTGFNLAISSVDKNGIYSGSDSLSQFNTYAKMSGTQVYAQGKFPGFPFYSLYDKVSGLFLSSYENSFIHGLGNTYSVVGASPDATYSLSRNKIIDNRRSSIFSYPGKINLSVGYDKTWQITIDTSKFEIVRYASGALRSYNLLPASEWPETTANSISQLAWTAGSPSFLRSQHGVATGTTDINGDLTLTLPAAMPDNTYTMLITVEGTTSRLYTVHTKGTSSCKVRFYGATTGSALPTTSVSISYEAKNY